MIILKAYIGKINHIRYEELVKLYETEDNRYFMETVGMKPRLTEIIEDEFNIYLSNM